MTCFSKAHANTNGEGLACGKGGDAESVAEMIGG
jgi:hypothetical protein